MKKLSALVALALLAVAGTGLAVTCAQDNVPAATLLVPYFRVSRNGITTTATDIPAVAGQTDTQIGITNVSNTGIIVHATVWNKYSLPVLDFNIPMTAYDVAFFSMQQILNGQLNVNLGTLEAQVDASAKNDPCGINQLSGTYDPTTGFDPLLFIRFPNPSSLDASQSISVYAPVAFTGTFRKNVWDQLDESGDVTSFTSPGAFTIDTDNCGTVDGTISGDFSGYVTLDVVNYCTNFFPDSVNFYRNDAIATLGWDTGNGGPGSPNVIMGDVFYIDQKATNGNISGDPAVALEFAPFFDWRFERTFYRRYLTAADTGVPVTAAAAPYAFIGDGREPLGQHYAFRYLSDAANGLQSWALVWRSDVYNNFGAANSITADSVNLCGWLGRSSSGKVGHGLYDSPHQLIVRTFDVDENEFVTSGGPSPGTTSPPLYIFLETQRIDLLGNGDINPGGFTGGWINLFTPGFDVTNETWVGIQHTGLAAFLSVGHGATLLSPELLFGDLGAGADGVCFSGLRRLESAK